MTGSTIGSDPRVAQLFAEPPERFTAARDALAADLAHSGARGSAEEVRALRRPTRRVWVLNRIAREHPDEATRLLEAGAELRRAHAAAVRGERSALRDADLELSQRLDALVEVAGRIAKDVGHAVDHALLVGLRNDLRALATTESQHAERFRSGTLDRAPRGGGDDLLAELTSVAAASPRSPPRGAEPDVRPSSAVRPGPAARPSVRDVRRDLERGRASARAKQELRSAERALAAAQRELERREAAAARAEAVAAKSRSSAEEARKAVEARRARVEGLRRTLPR